MLQKMASEQSVQQRVATDDRLKILEENHKQMISMLERMAQNQELLTETVRTMASTDADSDSPDDSGPWQVLTQV